MHRTSNYPTVEVTMEGGVIQNIITPVGVRVIVMTFDKDASEEDKNRDSWDEELGCFRTEYVSEADRHAPPVHPHVPGYNQLLFRTNNLFNRAEIWLRESRLPPASVDDVCEVDQLGWALSGTWDDRRITIRVDNEDAKTSRRVHWAAAPVQDRMKAVEMLPELIRNALAEVNPHDLERIGTNLVDMESRLDRLFGPTPPLDVRPVSQDDEVRPK